jgi:hypothetical protein
VLVWHVGWIGALDDAVDKASRAPTYGRSELPTRFDLVINLGTAKVPGLNVYNRKNRI